MATNEEVETIKAVYEAMQAGSAGEDQMASLFTLDGVLVESFTGTAREHRGREAVREYFRVATSMPRPDDFKLSLDRLDSQGSETIAEWTCTGSGMPAPLKGRDAYELEGGKIKRLEIQLVGGAA